MLYLHQRNGVTAMLYQLVYTGVSQSQLAYARGLAAQFGVCVDDVWVHDEGDSLVNFNVVHAAGATPQMVAFATAFGA